MDVLMQIKSKPPLPRNSDKSIGSLPQFQFTSEFLIDDCPLSVATNLIAMKEIN